MVILVQNEKGGENFMNQIIEVIYENNVFKPLTPQGNRMKISKIKDF